VNGGPQTSVGTSAVWVDNKGTGRVVNSANELRVSPTPGAASTPGLEAPSDLPYDKPGSLLFRTLTYADLRALPTEPAALKNELIRLSGASAPTIEDLYDRMGDLLTLQATPPGVRVGLARLLMDNGATVLGPVQDRNGRQGLGVAAPLADGSRRVFVLDTTTYRRLGDFTVPAGATTSAAAAIAWNTVLDNLIVDSTATR